MMNIQQLDRCVVFMEGVFFTLFAIYIVPMIWRDLKNDIKILRTKEKDSTEDQSAESPDKILSH